MSMIERALMALAPGVARRRAEDRLAAGAAAVAREALSYDAARRDTGDGWLPVSSGPNALAAMDGPRARAAARDAVRNNPLARRAIDVLAAHMVGTGFQPRLPDLSERQRKAPMAAWRRFVRSCDPEGLFRFHARARLAVSAMIDGGFAFLHYRPGPPEAPLLVDVLEADFLDTSRHGVLARGGPDGATTFHGLEFDADGRRTAYWLFDRHPGETGALPARSRRVPAAEIDPVFLPRRPGEVVPATWFAPAVETLRDRKDYLLSERMRAKVQACLALIVRGARPGAIEGLKTSGQASAASAIGASAAGPMTDAQGRLVEGMRPGMIAYAGAGSEVTAFEPKALAAVKDFVWVADHDVATSFGMPHFLLTGDMSGVNFASSQMGLIQFHAMLDVWQADVVEALIYARAWDRAMAAARRLGELHADPPEPGWAAPRRHYADVVKTAKAQREEIEAGIVSTPGVIRSRGDDPDEVLSEQAEWAEKRAAKMPPAPGTAPQPPPGQAPAQADPADQNPPKGDDDAE